MQRLSFTMVLALLIGITVSSHAFASEKHELSSISKKSNVSLLGTKGVTGGQFVGVDHPTQGQVKIVEEDGVKYLEISEDFKTDSGPDLKVILHNSNTVEMTVQEGDYISLGALESFNGSQRYAIPNEVELDQYQSVAIWCEEFNVTFGYAPLAK